ncbi:MAG: RNA 2',3'-cyclic phosphodiesterase [Armatimonadetes bacterium]|nr:RNA 2',3'-cyclic phosphodiesterase [Armatimonadota bacterium]
MTARDEWRLFFAIPVSDEVRSGAAEVQKRLAAALGGMVKWVEPANLHVTLKFIGNVPATSVEQVKQIGWEAAAQAVGAEMVVRGVGAFPSPRRARVIWAGLHGDTRPVAQTAKTLDTALAQAGLAKPEDRPFTPHMTLGRIRRHGRPPDLTSAVSALAEVELGTVQFAGFVLMRSFLHPSGPVYEVIEHFAVAGRPSRGE